jgi:putative membrane protein
MRFTCFAFLFASASAFQAQPAATRFSTKLYGNTKTPPVIPAPKELSYGEESRRYRRTVYSHDDWVKHRSSDRFIRNILTTASSGIYKNVAREVWASTLIATFICLWNMAAGGYTAFDGVTHEAVIQSIYLPALSLPLTGFTLLSPFLGLLLGKLSGNIQNIIRCFASWSDKLLRSLSYKCGVQALGRSS